jgi:PKD repeat protein
MKKLYTIAFVVLGMLVARTVHAQTVTLKSGTTTIGTYNAIQAAYNAIPAVLTQPYTIEVAQAYTTAAETFPITFTNKAGASNANTITIRPSQTLIPSTSSVQIMSFGPTQDPVFIFDNADWIVIDGGQLFDPVTGNPSLVIGAVPTGSSLSPWVIDMKNGSCNNKVMNAFILCYGAHTGINFGLSPTEASGNSYNTIQGNMILNGTNGIRSSGTVANPNKRLTISSNQLFSDATGVNLDEGTGYVLIDSNIISDNSATDSSFGIRHGALTDTLIATRNTIGITGHSSVFPAPVPTRGIQVVSATAPANYVFLANNMVFTNKLKTVDGDTAYYEEDGLDNLAGIEITGEKLTARVYHNTVKINGALSSSLSGAVVSSALAIDMVGPGVDYEMFANIFTNERTGGNGLAQHVVVDMYTFSYAMFLEGNTYNKSATGNIARVHNTIYNTMAAYKAQVSPTEFTSNEEPVKFVDDLDLHLHHSMMGNTNIMVSSANIVPDDIDGIARLLGNQYRGADEYIVNCNSATVLAGEIEATDDSVCAGHIAEVTAYDMGMGNGIMYKWQTRPAGSSQPWADVAGEDRSTLRMKITQPTEFRFVDSCVAGSVARSQPITVGLFPMADITSVSDVHIDLNYLFTANGTTPGLVEWDFGDGNTASGNTNTANHTYATIGIYTVRAIASSNCGSDTMDYTVTATTSVDDVANGKEIRIYPNPTHSNFTIECPSITAGNAQLSLTSLTGARVYSSTATTTGKSFATTVDVSALPAGMYLVELRGDDKLYRTTVVVR